MVPGGVFWPGGGGMAPGAVSEGVPPGVAVPDPGGLVPGAAVPGFPGFDGVMPGCGVLGDVALGVVFGVVVPFGLVVPGVPVWGCGAAV